MDSPPLLTLSKDKEQKAESYNKEHSELFFNVGNTNGQVSEREV